MTPSAVAESTLADAAREARALAAKAGDIAQDRMRAVRRSYRDAQHRIEDAAGDAASLVRKQPLKAVGAALGAGLVLGVAGTMLVRAIAARCSADR